MDKIGFGEALITGVMGYAVVFFGLILLMLVVTALGKVMSRKTASAKVAAPVAAAPVVEKKPAPGTAGEVKLYDVADRDAAMIMAIVADKMGRPLNELRFKSIKEVK